MKSLQSKIRWGILGTGYIAHKFAEALSYIPDAELIAVGSRTQESSSAFAREFAIPRIYASYQALLADADVDIVYVATVNTCHRENCLDALNAGKPVLCEKPFTVNTFEAEQVIALAKEKKVFLMEALWTRFIPAFVEARKMWEQGTIGELFSTISDFGFICTPGAANPLYRSDLAGGAFLDVGAYPVSLAHIVFGEPNSIEGLANMGKTGVDEQSAMIFKYDNGKMALGYASFKVESPKEATILGNKGYIRIHSPFFCPSSFTVVLNGKAPQTYHFPYKGNGWNYEAEEAMKCLREGRLESEVVPHTESLSLMRTMDRFRETIDLHFPFEGTPISI